MRSLLYIVIIALLTVCSCSTHRPEALDRADRLMASDLEAALKFLSEKHNSHHLN